MEPRAERVELGRVLGPHGLRGQIRVRILGDGPEHLLGAGRVRLSRPHGDPAAASHPGPGAEAIDREYAITGAGAGRAGEVRLALEGVEDRDAAVALRGCTVSVEAATLEPLPEGEHYWYELLGCEVVAGGQPRGRVREIWETGAHDVMVVEAPDGSICLIPTARELVLEIDVEERRIRVEDLPGLFEPAGRL